MIIGITGNSGSGKSTISKKLSKKIDAKIVDADMIVKKLSETESIYYKKIVELFGKEILQSDKLNKRKIAEIIYNDNEKREALNKLTYKYVVDEIKQEVQKTNNQNIIIDAPLLFESNLDKICDFTIAVLAEKNIKLERIKARDKLDDKTANERLKIQQKDNYYIERANYVIKNNGKIDEINMEEICTIIGMN